MKKNNKNLLIILGSVTFVACVILGIWFGYAFQNYRVLQLLAERMNIRKNTPTAFQPFQNTAIPTRDVQPIANALVPNNGMVPPEGQINILLLGSDWRPGGGFRTDVILLISIFTKESKVSLVSFPRDLWVEIPSREENRINTVMVAGGFPLVNQTFQRNFAVNIDHYMMTNFNGFQSIVDTLGGIDIVASKNTADRCDLSSKHGAWCSIGPGEAHLDGELALWYVRSRYTTSDFDRTRRAQEVLIGFFKKLMSINAISRAPDVYNQFVSSVEMDLTINDFLSLINLAPILFSDPSRVEQYAIGTEHVTSYIIPSTGAAVLLPNYEAIWEVIKEAVYIP